VATDPQGQHAAAYLAIARLVAARLADGQGARAAPAIVFD
jgi:hypothetical protein